MKRAGLGNEDQADSGGESGSGQLALGVEMSAYSGLHSWPQILTLFCIHAFGNGTLQFLLLIGQSRFQFPLALG